MDLWVRPAPPMPSVFVALLGYEVADHSVSLDFVGIDLFIYSRVLEPSVPIFSQPVVLGFSATCNPRRCNASFISVASLPCKMVVSRSAQNRADASVQIPPARFFAEWARPRQAAPSPLQPPGLPSGSSDAARGFPQLAA